ncbi:hypothetical protein [Bacillus cereus]|uniref:Uncharacterized protein n=1 Tax=Bacillus cereus HuA3-9 TaxID=1053205 RepID=R8CID1_BACCE|nr:hypothetical protein [Bacillus cereus]EOO11389.1 hypothetical protein IGA_05652 [Bacillus cereus HuA3-9]
MTELLNQWHCDEDDCEKVFYTILGDVAEHCPFCESYDISDGRVFKVEPLIK